MSGNYSDKAENPVELQNHDESQKLIPATQMNITEKNLVVEVEPGEILLASSSSLTMTKQPATTSNKVKKVPHIIISDQNS